MHGPRLQTRSLAWRYAFAVLAAGIAVALTMSFRRLGLGEPPIAAFLAAILLTGWYAGRGPVVLATALSLLAFDFFFVPPLHHIDFVRSLNPRVVWFLVFAVLAAAFSTARLRAAERLARARDELEERVAARTEELRQSTEELRRSEAYLVAAQELSHTGSWSGPVNGGEAHWSEETYRIFGLDPRGPAPNFQQLVQMCHPNDRTAYQQAAEAAIREMREFELDFRIVRSDGSIRHLHSKGQPVLDGAGAVVEVAGVVMDVTERKRADRALRRARERALEARFSAVLDERNRLARELHDTLLQGFTGVALRLVALAGRLEGPPAAVTQLRDLIAMAQGTLEDARRSVWDLRSPGRTGDNLATALRANAENSLSGTDLALEFGTDGVPGTIDPEVQAVLLRVMHEALVNTVKHAAARTVRITLGYESQRVRLSIVDDGRGFVVDPDLRSYGGHWGLLGMRERASQLRGTLSISSTPGNGTEIVLRVPYSTRDTARRLPVESGDPNGEPPVANHEASVTSHQSSG